MIRVPTLTDQHRQDHARVLIMACRLHPPPACRDGHRIPVSMREPLEGLLTDPRKPRGEAASAAVAGIGDGRGLGVRARRGAGGRTDGELGPGRAGRARLPHQPADRAARPAVSLDAGPAPESSSSATPRGITVSETQRYVHARHQRRACPGHTVVSGLRPARRGAAGPVVMIRVPTLTDQNRQDHARVLIMACRLHPPPPACRRRPPDPCPCGSRWRVS